MDKKCLLDQLENVLTQLGWKWATLEDEKKTINGLFVGNETFFKKLEDDT